MDNISIITQQAFIGSLLSKKLDLSLSVHGVSFTEFTIMYHLHSAYERKLSRVHLAEKVGLTASGVTRVLLPMEKNHLVFKESNPRDARQSLVVLTDVGHEVLTDALVTVKHTADSIFSLLDQEELSTLQVIINKLKL